MEGVDQDLGEEEVETKTSSETIRELSFDLAGERYSIDLLKVQEIIQKTTITRIPKVSQFILGVINLRGQVIPVISLRKRFRIVDQKDELEKNCIIVVLSEFDGEIIPFGILVDEVKEVLDLEIDKLQEAPESNTHSVDNQFIMSSYLHKDILVTQLDIRHIVKDHQAAE